MSAYWIWTIPADVADEKVKEWTTIQQFEGYEYNHDYDEDQPVYREVRAPVVNGVVFEYYKDGDEWIAFGSNEITRTTWKGMISWILRLSTKILNPSSC